MYNLYIYEKNISEKVKKELEEEKSRKYKEKRKLELDKLTSNYNKRMDNFILSLCKHPIYLKDLTNKNTTQLIIDEEKSSQKKIFQKKKYKNFSFGGFITDKKRLKLLYEEKEINRRYEEEIIKNKMKQEEKIEKKKLKNNKILIQPRMRFKPRNELERISDVMNILGENKNKKKIKNILEQLKQIDLDRLKQTKGFGKLKQIYKKHKLYLEQNKNKNDKNDKKNKPNESISESSDDNDEEEELELDFSLETNLHRKLRNMNLRIEKENKIKNKMLKDRGDNTNENSLDKKIKEKNKRLLELFKDDEKLYFKGAAQYALNKPKHNLISNKININENVRSLSAFPLKNSRNIITSPKSFSSKLNENNNIFFSNRLKRPMSMFDLFNEQINRKKNIYENDIIKKLDIKYQIKKQNMDKLFNEEINNSLLNDFYKKLSKKEEYSKVLENPFYLEKNLDILKKPQEVDKDLDNKLEYLKKVIKMNYKEGVWSANNSKKRFGDNKKINFRRIYRKKKKEDKNKIKHNDDDIIIDGIKYNNDDIKNIADIIFTKCGYYHKKII